MQVPFSSDQSNSATMILSFSFSFPSLFDFWQTQQNSFTNFSSTHTSTRAEKIRKVRERYQRFTRRNIRTQRRCARCKKREEAKQRREGGGGGSSTSTMWRNEHTHTHTHTREYTHIHAHVSHTKLRERAGRPVNLFLPEMALSLPVRAPTNPSRGPPGLLRGEFQRAVNHAYHARVANITHDFPPNRAFVAAGKFGAAID